MPYILFVDSSNNVTLYPEWDFDNDRRKIETEHRSRSGRLTKYKWADYRRFRFSVEHLDSSEMSIINSWWVSNTQLLFMEEGGTDVYSVYLQNRNQPIDKFVKPYTDLFKGTIELETY